MAPHGRGGGGGEAEVPPQLVALNISEQVRKMSQPILTSTVVALRRETDTAAYRHRDFKIMLLQQPDKTYRFPELPVRAGESPQQCGKRTLKHTCGLDAAICEVVGFRTTLQRDRRDNVATVVCFAAANPDQAPAGCKYYSLSAVVGNKDYFVLADDHREIMHSVVGWIRQRYALKTIDGVFSRHTRKAPKPIANPLFGKGMESVIDKPLLSYNNPWFLTGELKPRGPAVRERFTSFRAQPISVQGSGLDDSRTEAAAATLRRAQTTSDRPVSRVEAWSPGRAASERPTRAAGRPKALDFSQIGQRLSAEHQEAEDEAASPISPTPGSGWQHGGSGHGQPAFPPLHGARLAPPTEFAGTSAPAGVPADYSRRSSIELGSQLDFNPLADDLNADFSNPLRAV